MATIRRAGFGSVFEVENETVGIGTTGTATNTVQVLGETKTSNALITGFATFTTYQGFVDNNAEFGNSNVDINSQSGTMGDIEICHGDFNVSSASTLTSSVNELTVTNSFSLPVGGIDSRVHCKTAGSMRFNQDLGTLEFYTGEQWKIISYSAQGASRGYLAGGYTGSAAITTIDLINISTLGNSVHFGDSTISNMRNNVGRASSKIEGFSMASGSDSTILVFTLSTTGNAIGFAENTTAIAGSLASATRALNASNSSSSKTVDYFEMSTKADAIDFGDLSEGRNEIGAVSSETRGIFCGGGAPSGTGPKSTMDFFTIATKGNAADFGNLQQTKGQLGGGVSDGTRGVVAGGYGTPVHKKEIDFMTIPSNGHATVFGDLIVHRAEQAGATCNRVRGLFCGGATPSSPNKTNSMEYITIASTGDGQDFGDLTAPRDRVGGGCISDSHGGLGGF